MLRAIILSSFFLFLVGSLKAQLVLKDSTYIYKKIEGYSNKRPFTKFIYKSFFRFKSPPPVSPKKKTRSVAKQVPYANCEGKIIRDIHIVTYDPFGYDTKDTSITPHEFLPRAGNVLHVKTIPIKIRNIMLVKKYDTFDSLKVKESERLVRSQNFVREVFISNVLFNDSIDIYVRVYDGWSAIITGDASPTSFMIDLQEKNILGTGHLFQNKYKQNYFTGENSNSSTYYIPNIYNTYINSSIHYNIDEHKNYMTSFSLNRPFYSIFTSWAGGISLQQQVNHEILTGFDSVKFTQTYKSNSEDFWLGRSWQLFKGRSEEQRSTSIITNARYLRVHYVTRAEERFDTLHLHPNQDFYLVGIGLSKRLYKQDKYIFRYGSTEDVPIGRSYSLVGGYQIKDNLSRWYVGSRIYMAKYHSWGYFNIYLEYGTFLKQSKFEEGSFSTGINYFSNIFKIGRWQIRQFIKPQFTIGHNRLRSDNLSLNSEAGIRGFNGIGLTGTQKFLFTFQLQSYAPWNLIGFRFGPYIVCSFGMLGTEKSGFAGSPLYSSFGIGVLIKNEYLILSTFQISIAYYPIVPGGKNNSIKLNPVKTTDFGFRGFDISAPSQVSYQ
ncbi:MAG: hypothetical protein A3F72_15800 [Bacteroidetes bacterium RIFCSPLOWO2_12_FULL_35_15]|nr:MAG: hypothetical protein A3F72_15800 [Bacteroidetes bacterium RIFCSPLOWO2_12_FULL_35_15]